MRPAEARDGERLAALQTAASLGQFPVTAATLARRRTPCLVAEEGGAVRAGVWHWRVGPVAPDHERLQLAGDPAHFTPLLTALLARLPADTAALHSVVREDHGPQMHFLAAAGFRNAHQSWGAHLNLGTFDPSRFAALEERLFLAGVEVTGPEEPLPWPALHRLYEEGRRDTPRNPTTTPDPQDPAAFQAALTRGQVFVAVARAQPIAFAWLSVNGRAVELEFTAVTPAWRGRGVATLLTAHSLQWARAAGHERASTGGTLLHLPTLRVNARMGFEVEPMWATWVRSLT